jgi:hypothetical protein
MPLTPTKRAAIAAFGSVSFFMADDQRIVRIDVSKELLKRFGRPPLKSTKDYLDRVHKHKNRLEKIASAKYDAGKFTTEVRVHVVEITDKDYSSRRKGTRHG